MRFEPSTPATGSADFTPVTARFTLDLDPFAGQTFTTAFGVCGQPCCPCSVVGFHCRAEAAPELPPLYFDLDILKRELAINTHAVPDGVALGRAFLAEAQKPEWDWLREFLLAAKRRQMESMDLDTLEVVLPADFDADASAMVSYLEVFPWGELIRFKQGGSEWFVDDQYCARPGCDCKEVGLGCFQLPTGEGPSAKPLECVSFFFHDYVTGKTRLDKAEPGSPGPLVLLESLRAANPDFVGLLRRRHGHLQHLGRRLCPKSVQNGARGRHSWDNAMEAWPAKAPPAQAIKVPARPGRNDACPCGSGKKFKKCCGAA